MHFEMTFYAMQQNHEMWVHNLRELNFYQGVRQEAALKSMRELREKTRKDHLKEIQDIRLKYDSMLKEHEIEIKSLVEENELLRVDHESVPQDLRGTTQVLKADMKTTVRSLLSEKDSIIQLLRNECNSPLGIWNLTKQNGPEAERLQRKLAEKEKRTIITAVSFQKGMKLYYSDVNIVHYYGHFHLVIFVRVPLYLLIN